LRCNLDHEKFDAWFVDLTKKPNTSKKNRSQNIFRIQLTEYKLFIQLFQIFGIHSEFFDKSSYHTKNSMKNG